MVVCGIKDPRAFYLVALPRVTSILKVISESKMAAGNPAITSHPSQLKRRRGEEEPALSLLGHFWKLQLCLSPLVKLSHKATSSCKGD